MEESTKSLYTPEVYQDCLSRIEKLKPDSQPQWGKMTAAQMLAHCSEIQEVTNGKELKGTPFFVKLFKGMIRKMVISDKPYPRNSQTHPQYRQSMDCNFDEEKKRLLTALDVFVKQDKQEAAQKKHPLFGKMSRDEKGWAMYKHLDHHLTQFGM